MTARSRVVGLCLKSVDASDDSCVEPFDKSKDNLSEGHAQQGKVKGLEKGRVEFSHLKSVQQNCEPTCQRRCIELCAPREQTPTRQ